MKQTFILTFEVQTLPRNSSATEYMFMNRVATEAASLKSLVEIWNCRGSDTRLVLGIAFGSKILKWKAFKYLPVSQYLVISENIHLIKEL